MKIVSWNINGIRSLKKDMSAVINDLEADIACFQETKVSSEQLAEKLALVTGYRSYFSYSKARAGYSGVAIYCTRAMQPESVTNSLLKPLDGEDGEPTLSLPKDVLKALDNEGRTVMTQHKLREKVNGKSLLTLINVYCPCVTGEKEGRELFRLQFLQILEERIRQLQEISVVIVVGDINISHKVIDSCDPGDTQEFLSQPHRQWLDKMLSADSGVIIDSYRILHPDQKYAYTCWNTRINARQTNFGTRIDYILLDKCLRENLVTSEVLAKYMGSDHCPVRAELTNLDIQKSASVPRLCTSRKYVGVQTSILMFMSSKSKKGKSVLNTSCADSDYTTAPEERKLESNSPSLSQSTPSEVSSQSQPCDKPKSPDTKSEPVGRKRKSTPLSTYFINDSKDLSDEKKVKLKANSRRSSESSPSEASTQSQPSDKSDSQDGTTTASQSQAWNMIFPKKSQSVPECSAHKEACILQTVKKVGKTKGRQFYSCARPVGLPSDKQARCSYFLWSDQM